MALVARGLQALVSNSVTGTRRLGREEVIFEEIIFQHDLLHLFFKLITTRPIPIGIPAFQVIFAGTAVGEEGIGFFGKFT